ncbi:MAG: alpha/beta hydrolase, partial [Myxococcales bacterium]|nr:alpha/beta hydrolase [Myxococcales bacterium]
MNTQATPQPSLLRKFLRWSLIAAAALFVAFAALLVARPEALLFHPTPIVSRTPDEIGWAYEPVTLTTEDGEQLGAWYLAADPSGALADRNAVVLYCHGNAGNIGGRMPALSGLRPLGMSVLIFDYRGYGDSTGRPTVAGTRLDIAAAWEHLLTRGFAPDHIVLWGRSLGGAIAIDQAARASEAGTPPGALVVESTFTSTLDIGEEVYPWLPVRWLGAKLD